MGSSKLRKAVGAMKDQTSIGLAKISNTSTVSDLDVAIVKATRHSEHPADEKHIREILSLTCYSRTYVSACVSTLSRRLSKTKSWTVALKTLILVHRLLSEGDPAYEQEIFFATRRGTRMLNMSDFRDASRADAWDFSAFVRTFALYLDERLDYRMHGRRTRRGSRASIHEDIEEKEETKNASSRTATPVREMRTERLFSRTHHLQQLLERFLACRPTGAAKNNRIVAVALYPLVKESFQLYLDLVELMNVFIDRFMDIEVRDCVKIYGIFSRLSKQFEELDSFYNWCKSAGIARPSEYPSVELITPQKLQVMDEFIRDRSAMSQQTEEEYDMNNIKALPAPEHEPEPEPIVQETKENEETVEEKKEDASPPPAENAEKEEEEVEVDFLNLREEMVSAEAHGDQLALALFDGAAAAGPATGAPVLEAFKDEADWEAALVQSATGFTGQHAKLGGGFDMTLLDGMYSAPVHQQQQGFLTGGSASSLALPPRQQQPMLALPAPPEKGGTAAAGEDPFVASATVPPPSYVQMSEMEKRQHLLVEEQFMWQQYARDGMQGQMSLAKIHQQQQQGFFQHQQGWQTPQRF